MNEKEMHELKYKIAIDARDKLNDNYHKWMTFYYVANGAILVAITTLFLKHDSNKGIFALSLIGVLVCMIWNLSCKGYYYWSNNWIELIHNLENQLFLDENYIYKGFSKKVAEGEKPSWYPLAPNNISTPKLTLLFSFISFVSWAIYSVYIFNILFQEGFLFNKTIDSILLSLTVLISYIMLPKFVKSRKDEQHVLV